MRGCDVRRSSLKTDTAIGAMSLLRETSRHQRIEEPNMSVYKLMGDSGILEDSRPKAITVYLHVVTVGDLWVLVPLQNNRNNINSVHGGCGVLRDRSSKPSGSTAMSSLSETSRYRCPGRKKKFDPTKHMCGCAVLVGPWAILKIAQSSLWCRRESLSVYMPLHRK
jgi:hypothetical protein